MLRFIGYIKECCKAAIAIREQRGAIGSLIGALLAFPIVRILGGTFELTIEGSWWIALWVTLSALITLFIISPFHIWTDQKKRISLLEDQIRPGIEIQFDASDPRHMSRTHFNKDKEDRAIFVSVLPRATQTSGQINNCQGYINSVWIMEQNGNWLPTHFNNRQQLFWGSPGIGDTTKENIDSVTRQPLNVFFVKQNDPRIHPCIPKMLNRHKPLFHERSKDIFRLDIVVVGDGISPAQISLKVQLGDKWDDINIEKIIV
jgi:hypothetical protein